MSAVAEIPVAPSLDDLAATANREHRLAQQSGEAMVRHAVRAGDALMYAKAAMGRGEWLPWLKVNFSGSERLAQCYTRLAEHSDIVVDGGATSLRSALALIAYEGRASWGPAGVKKARRLYATGDYTHAQLAEQFGVSKPTITRWLDKKASQKDKARARRERSARRALARQQDERAARQIGGPLAEAYSRVRRALQAAEKAHEEATTPEVKAALSTAVHRLYGAEDEIGKAVRLS